MAIDASIISKSIYDLPIHPLFNTIRRVMGRAGVPIVVTNTETALTVVAQATVGSAPLHTTLTQDMFDANVSGFEVFGFRLTDNKYYTKLDLDQNIDQYPLSGRTEVGGIEYAQVVAILTAIGAQISAKLLSDFFAVLQPTVTALVPAGNVTAGQAGLIGWDPLAPAPAGGRLITAVLDDLIAALPNTMKPGGSADGIVTAWVSADDFTTMKNSSVRAYQPNDNQGLTSNYFAYVKESMSVNEMRDEFTTEKLRYKNVIILPMNGLAKDTLLLTYQEGIENSRVFYDKVPMNQLNNFYMAIKGLFIRNDQLVVPLAENADRALSSLPFICGNLLTINKVDTGINEYNIISELGFTPFFRELDKFFAVFPNPAA